MIVSIKTAKKFAVFLCSGRFLFRSGRFALGPFNLGFEYANMITAGTAVVIMRERICDSVLIGDPFHI